VSGAKRNGVIGEKKKRKCEIGRDEERDQLTIYFEAKGAVGRCALHAGKVYLLMNLLNNDT